MMYTQVKIAMKRFSESLREYKMKIIDFEKKKMIQLTNEDYESYLNQTNCHINKKGLKINTLMIKNIIELETTAIIVVNIEVLYT